MSSFLTNLIVLLPEYIAAARSRPQASVADEGCTTTSQKRKSESDQIAEAEFAPSPRMLGARGESCGPTGRPHCSDIPFAILFAFHHQLHLHTFTFELFPIFLT